MPTLYLIPTLLDEEGDAHIPPISVHHVGELNHFIVERLRTARRFIKKVQSDYDIDKAVFIELDKHDMKLSFASAAELFKTGVDVGLMSEAGSPCLADPGTKIVEIARSANYKIRPLSGPSSIMLAIMASGLNGQEFTFHGYLPVKDGLTKKLSQMESQIRKTKFSQIWIETPYRNDKMLETLISTIDGNLMLSIAVGLNGPGEVIDTKPVHRWKGHKIGKVPAIFILGA